MIFLSLPPFPEDWLIGFILIGIFVVGSIFSKKIDVLGGIAGGIVTAAMVLGASWMGLLLIIIFFGLGSFASSWSLKEKQALGLEQENKGKRTTINVLANGGVAGVCGLFAWWIPELNYLLQVAMTASIAGATADTLSSEFGNIYGSRYRNILTFKRDERGKDGVISTEGTLFGLIGCGLIALLFGVFHGFPIEMILIFIIGNLGNLFDSVLGASLQQDGTLNNHSVNFGNTLFCAFMVIFLMTFM